MSCVIVLAPVVVAAWPVMAASITAACATAGFTVQRRRVGPTFDVTHSKKIVELTLENAEVVEDSLRPDDAITVEKDGVKVTFSRDARGQFKTCVEGPLPKAELTAIGEDLSGRVIQQYVYRRLATELAQSGFTTVSADRGEDEAIRLHVSRYEG